MCYIETTILLYIYTIYLASSQLKNKNITLSKIANVCVCYIAGGNVHIRGWGGGGHQIVTTHPVKVYVTVMWEHTVLRPLIIFNQSQPSSVYVNYFLVVVRIWFYLSISLVMNHSIIR